ncbi:alpha/beta fold hydrolase [Dictyobacter aurantiacus]|uniref:Alpha/beta hydrolase n=1 Tax=Dictyobacter aurantiacus TaxID=1936993 RepID=A0A401ZIN0_9CHLR|nr:alpha/beta hydrolase [Dictyobacter aurantiacus]GCE06688.1 alpha/beta hydrolase [Dictyobacter aurantiacus]
MGKVHSKDGTLIAFDRLGEGTPLILVDGAMCYRGFGPMGELAPKLATHFTVFSYDRRGRGESGDTLPYAVERETEDLDALIQEAGGSAFVYGISSGAALSLVATASGLAIKKLALYEPPFNLDEGTRAQSLAALAQIRRLSAEGRWGEMVEAFMRQVGLPAEAISQMRNAPMWSMMEVLAPTLVYDLTIVGDGSLPRERASSLSIPTLVMAGGAGWPWMLDSTQALASTIPNAQYRVLLGQMHDVSADAMAPALIEFFTAS